MRMFLAGALLIFGACTSSGVTAEQPSVSLKLLTCEDFDAVVSGDGVVFNNVWNKQAAGELDWSQCLVREDGEGRYGWTWDWPTDPQAVFAYPQIRYGVSPWSPDPRFGDDMPVQLSAIERFSVSHKLDIEWDGNFNVATSLWLGEGAEPKSEAIRAEVMIWTFYTPGLWPPAGKKQGTVALGGGEWEIWLNRDWYDVSGVNENRWTYLTFRNTSPSLDVEIDVAALLAYGVEQGYLDAKWYAYDLETGQEIMGGTGSTLVERFDVTIE